tara:strand:- start:11455 stop:11625 length:171 start_codon:yes stop_codon:yes gene_type:complete
MPLYRLANTGASEVFAVFGGKIPRTPIPKQPIFFLRRILNWLKMFNVQLRSENSRQ